MSDTVDAVMPESAGEPQKKPRGKPFTPENAKAMAMSAARAKKARKETRMKMLAALTERLDMGEELYRAMSTRDFDYLNMIEKAVRLVGLHHEQSNEAIAQKLEVKADANVKKDSTVKLIIEDYTKPEES